MHKELVPVSIKLKTTLRTDKARKIIRTAERHLQQARVKAINSILDNIAKQTEFVFLSLGMFKELFIIFIV